MESLLLLGSGFLLGLEARVGTSGELVLELLDPSGGVNELEFARVERMADVANVDLQFGPGAPGDETVPATAGDLGLEIFWLNAVFHGEKPWI